MKMYRGVVDMSHGYIREEATEKDTYAYMNHLIDNLLLMLSVDHEVINQDGTVQLKAKGATA